MNPYSDEKIVDSWEKNASQWSAAVRGGHIESRKLITDKAIVEAVLGCSPESVLDIGCGEGWLIRELSSQVKHLVGVDVVPDLIEQAEIAGGGRFLIASYENIAACAVERLFDVVVCNFSLLGKESVEMLFEAIPTILNPDGVFIVQTPHPVLAGDLPYIDGWREGSWAGFGANFVDPAPWYFRTLESWIALFSGNGLRLLEVREPIHPQTYKPASVIFLGANKAMHASLGRKDLPQNMANIEIPDEAKQAQSVVEGVLGDSIVGIYLFGSAVVGGLRRDSDVDILVAVTNAPTFEQRKALVAQLMRVSGAIGNPQAIRPVELTVITVSDVVPWQFPPRAEFVYGEWLREELEAGSVPERVRDHDLAIVLKKVIDNSLPLNGSYAGKVFDPVPMTDIRRAIRDSLPGLLAEAGGDERNVVLTLSRMWLTASTGDIAPKDAAAEWAEKQAPSDHAILLKYAREGYLGVVEDRWEQQEDFEALVFYMKNSIEQCLDVL